MPFRYFAARHSVNDVLNKNVAAAKLYVWAHMVDAAYQMTNREEFALCQELKMLFGA